MLRRLLDHHNQTSGIFAEVGALLAIHRLHLLKGALVDATIIAR